MRKKSVILVLFIILFIVLRAVNCNIDISKIAKEYKRMFSEPINEYGLINNEYFNINNDGKYPEDTTNGINEAIEYANKNNIGYIQFQNGKYRVIGSGENGQIGIKLKSNIKINFNGAQIIQNPNSSQHYTTIAIYNAVNVEIANVEIIGDKVEHNYNEINSSHDDGMGIRIQSSNYVKITNANIHDMTGDGIIIAYGSENIDICNSMISNCRRQGISIVDGKKINIYNNELSNISGTGPQALIDIETFEYNKVVDEVKIYNNKFYESNSSTVILLYSGGKNIQVYENEISGSIHIYNVIDTLTISNNALSNGFIRTYDINRFNINNIEVLNNKLRQYTIDIEKANQLNIKGNIEQD